MKLEKLPSGSYRVRKMYKGQTYTLIFNHKPSSAEVIETLGEKMRDCTTASGTFESYCKEYIRDRSNVLSPSSMRTYNRHIKSLSKEFKSLNIKNITQADVQKEINLYAQNRAPKTVYTYHGFIATILGVYRPHFHLKTTLPQRIETDSYLPTNEDVRAILNAAKGTEDSIGFQLGVLSLRRAEICALKMDDLKGNELHIHADLVYNEKKWIRKETPKTDAGNRIVYLPDKLVDEINEKGYFFKYSPQKLNQHLQAYQKKLGIPKFRFHDLRHYYASYASTIMPEADAMALGGWKSDYVFKKVYRDSMKEQRKESASKFNSDIFLS